MMKEPLVGAALFIIFASVKIGQIDLGERPVLLAPMEDVTDASFRYICKQFGADMMYTEFISSDGLIRDAAKTSIKRFFISFIFSSANIQKKSRSFEQLSCLTLSAIRR